MKTSKVVLIALGTVLFVFVFVLAVSCAAALSSVPSRPSEPLSVPSVPPRYTTPLVPSESPQQVPAAQEGTITDGQEYLVGVDVAPGRYMTEGPATDNYVLLCYYDVKTGDRYDDQGVLNTAGESARVTLEEGQTFTSSGCKPWTKVS